MKKSKFEIGEKVEFRKYNLVDKITGKRFTGTRFEYCFRDNINAWYSQNELTKYVEKVKGKK